MCRIMYYEMVWKAVLFMSYIARGARKLISTEEVEAFVDNVLQFEVNREQRRSIVNSIMSAERNLAGAGDGVNTLQYPSCRIDEYRSESSRKELRKQIVKELLEYPRLENDDEITLGNGGAKPSKVLKEKKAFYVIGPPASGKSSISNKVAELFGAYILDSDYAKRKIPEYTDQESGASVVHEESDELIFRNKEGNMLKYCIENECNMVIPKIGHKAQSILAFCEGLHENGYQIFLISVELDRFKATQRAYYRYRDTKRYVPLSMIFDSYSNDPILNYFRIKQMRNGCFSGYAQISTDVKKGENFVLLEEENIPELRSIYGGAKYGK